MAKKQTVSDRDQQIVKGIIVLLHDNGYVDAAEFIARSLTVAQILEQLR